MRTNIRELFAIFIGISVVSGVVSVFVAAANFFLLRLSFHLKNAQIKSEKKCLPSAEHGRPVMSDPYDWLIASSKQPTSRHPT